MYSLIRMILEKKKFIFDKSEISVPCFVSKMEHVSMQAMRVVKTYLDLVYEIFQAIFWTGFVQWYFFYVK